MFQALWHYSLTDEQINYLFILANHTVTLALLMDALPEFTRLLYFPVSPHTEENILLAVPCPYKKSGFPASLSECRCPNSPWCSARGRDFQPFVVQTTGQMTMFRRESRSSEGSKFVLEGRNHWEEIICG